MVADDFGRLHLAADAPATGGQGVPPDVLQEWDRRYVWHPFTQMSEYEPLVFERGEGCTLVDIHGNRYLDGVSSLWCNVHGHRHPALDAAIRRQLDQVAHVTLLGASNPPAIVLAKRLVELAPPGLEHVFYSDNGATAVEVALKIAFQYWQQCPQPQPGKTRFLAFHHAYHGDTLGAVSVGGVDRFVRLFGPLLFDAVRAPAPDMYRLPDGISRDQACHHYLRQFEEILARHHEQLAAVVIEPLVQGAAGMLTHPDGFLRGVRELTQRYRVLLIADEVAVGFGRTGKMFACEHEDVTPDLLCLAKGITGGYLPLAATLATDTIYQAFLGSHSQLRTFFHGHTYGGNPLGAAVALASLDIFHQERTLEKLPEKTERLAGHLARLQKHAHVGDVRQRGLMAGVELVENKVTGQPFAWHQQRGAQVCRAVRRKGVWLRPLGDVIVVMPPLSVTLEEIDHIGQALEESIQKLTA